MLDLLTILGYFYNGVAGKVGFLGWESQQREGKVNNKQKRGVM